MSEEIVGTLVAENGNRSELVIATKVGNPMGRDANARGYSRKHIIDAAERSLRRLRTDYIDIYQTHIWDPATNLEEMIGGVRSSRSRRARCCTSGSPTCRSGSSRRRISMPSGTGLAQFVSVQNHYNLLWREDERELLPFCRAQGIGLDPVQPDGAGISVRAVAPARSDTAPSALKPMTTPTSFTVARRMRRLWIASRRSPLRGA